MKFYWKRQSPPHLPLFQTQDDTSPSIHNKASSSSPLVPRRARSLVTLNAGKQTRSHADYGSFDTSAQEYISHSRTSASTPIITPGSPSTCGSTASVQNVTLCPRGHTADNRQATSPPIQDLPDFGHITPPSFCRKIPPVKDTPTRMLPRNLPQQGGTDSESSTTSEPFEELFERVLVWPNAIVPYAGGGYAASTTRSGSVDSSENDATYGDSSDRRLYGSSARDESSQHEWWEDDSSYCDNSLCILILGCLTLIVVGEGMAIIWILQHQ